MTLHACKTTQTPIVRTPLDLSSDSVVLSRIYGKTDLSGTAYIRQLIQGEDQFSEKNEILYRIVFRKIIALGDKEGLYTIVDAPTRYLQGYQMGYRDHYFLSLDGHVLSSMSIGEEVPLGDECSFTILDMGKGKVGLAAELKTTGNSHFEVQTTIYQLLIDQLQHLMTIGTEYDNRNWIDLNPSNGECLAKRYTEQYRLVDTGGDWLDIDITRTEYAYNRQCEEDGIKVATTRRYVYKDGKYQLQI
jgi:hypothetical protein